MQQAKEFEELVASIPKKLEAIKHLIATNDPVATPYASKYKAREELRKLVDDVTRTKLVALTNNDVSVLRQSSAFLAKFQVQLASIAWDVEEPHETQGELEEAGLYYFGNYHKTIMEKTRDEQVEEETPTNNTKHETPSNKASSSSNEYVLTLPETVGKHGVGVSDVLVDALKCLNLFGILWAGRGHVKRSFMFFQSSYNLYHMYFDVVETKNTFTVDAMQAVEAEHTLTLFFLAQAYGHLHDFKNSAKFCHETLQRQLNSGFADVGAIDWVKNGLGMTEYYLMHDDQSETAVYNALSCEKVFNEHVLSKITTFSETSKTSALELKAEICKKLLAIDIKILKQAFEREASNKNIDTAWAKKADPSASKQLLLSSHAEAKEETMAYFSGLFIQIPKHTSAATIVGFDDAREVFLRALTRLETAKKIYVFDGYVSEHVELLLQNSKLYHYLSEFENDLKRKFAMESRRVELLTPMLRDISRTAYENLHKQLAYELGEVYLTLHDVKVALIQEKNNADELTPSMFKKADVLKCNEFVRQGLAMLTYFTLFYSSSKKVNFNILQNDVSIDEIEQAICDAPDESLLSEGELRPFFNCYFLSARLLSKYIPIASMATSPVKEDKAKYVVATLRRYRWLLEHASTLCSNKGLSVQDVFAVELHVCRDMADLLPGKIEYLRR